MSTPTPIPAPSAAAKIRRSMASPSVTGEADRVARVVCRVVDRLDRGEPGDTDEDYPEQDRGDAMAYRVAPRVGDLDRLDQTGHLVLLRPPPEDMRVANVASRSPGSRVIALLDLPGASRISSGLSRVLAAYSCEGSRGFEQALTAFPFVSRPAGTDGRHDDAGADVVLAHLGDPLSSSALRVPDQVGNDVRIHHVASQSMFSGAGTGSSTSWKPSSSGFIVLSKATSPRLRTGSITRRSPSRCMRASSPGSSNSTGIRTAWLRPLRNNLTCLCSGMSHLKAYATDICHGAPDLKRRGGRHNRGPTSKQIGRCGRRSDARWQALRCLSGGP